MNDTLRKMLLYLHLELRPHSNVLWRDAGVVERAALEMR